MAKTFNGNSKFWLSLVGMLIAGAVAWGVLANQQTVNSDDIKLLDGEKLSVEIFAMHIKQSDRQFQKIDEALTEINGKLDKLAERPK